MHERRSEQRFNLDRAITVKIIFASASPQLLGRRLKGSTADVSASGIKIQLNSELPVDSTIDMEVTLSDSEKYFLSGKVCWAEAGDAPGKYYIGISLQDLINDNTDLKGWKEAIKSLQQ